MRSFYYAGSWKEFKLSSSLEFLSRLKKLNQVKLCPHQTCKRNNPRHAASVRAALLRLLTGNLGEKSGQEDTAGITGIRCVKKHFQIHSSDRSGSRMIPKGGSQILNQGKASNISSYEKSSPGIEPLQMCGAGKGESSDPSRRMVQT